MSVPKFYEMFNPLITALKRLGGSASISEITDEVADVMQLTDEDVSSIHKGNMTQFAYRLAWTRNYLKRYGILENSSRGVWSLTEKGAATNEVDEKDVQHVVREMASDDDVEESVDEGKLPDGESVWQDAMIAALLEIKPDAFERLAQRVLRESGFVSVEVTGKSGDGGIDGKGIIKVGGLLSFHVIFQCKRYAGSISAQQIRDFRGAMVGRADKGLFITSGTFTRDARKEAVRDGAPPIDLVDGQDLVEKMKELGLGVIVKTEEQVSVDKDWLSKL